jgi:hypothetical protein
MPGLRPARDWKETYQLNPLMAAQAHHAAAVPAAESAR